MCDGSGRSASVSDCYIQARRNDDRPINDHVTCFELDLCAIYSEAVGLPLVQTDTEGVADVRVSAAVQAQKSSMSVVD